MCSLNRLDDFCAVLRWRAARRRMMRHRVAYCDTLLNGGSARCWNPGE
jgi:hypothetical protein